MSRFLIRRISFMLLTMFLVSAGMFFMAEIAPGNIAINTLGMNNLETLPNQGGRMRWKIENEGFNLEYAYNQDETASKKFYRLLQVAYLQFQSLEKGSLFHTAFPKGVRSLDNIVSRLLEAWRNLRFTSVGFNSLYGGSYQIRFDSS